MLLILMMLPLLVASQQDTVRLKQEISALQDSTKKFLDGLFDVRSFTHSFQARRETKGGQINGLKESMSGAAFDPISNLNDDAFWPKVFNRGHSRVVQASNIWVAVDILFTPVDSQYTATASFAVSRKFVERVDTLQYPLRSIHDSLVKKYFTGQRFAKPRDAQCYAYCKAFTDVINAEISAYYDRLVATTARERQNEEAVINAIVSRTIQLQRHNAGIINGNGSGNVSYILSDTTFSQFDQTALDDALTYANLTSTKDVVLVFPKIDFAIPRNKLGLFQQKANEQLKQTLPNTTMVVVPLLTEENIALNTLEYLTGGTQVDTVMNLAEPCFVIDDLPFAVKIADVLFRLLDTELQEQTTSAIGGAIQNNDNGGCIPEYFWNNTLSTKYHWATTGGTEELARMCGAVDGICSMGGDLVQVLGAVSTFKTNFKKYLIFKVINPQFGTAARWMGNVEGQVREFYELVTDKPKRDAFVGLIDSTLSELPNVLKEEALKTWNNVEENPAYRAYYQGRAGVMIVGSCIGLSEVAAIARGGKVSLVMMKAVMRHGRLVAKWSDNVAKKVGGAITLQQRKILIKKASQVVAEITDGKLLAHQVDVLAEAATKNANKRKVMLGHYSPDPTKVSYDREAGESFTFFHLENWNVVNNAVNESRDEIWKINKEFIKKQFDLGKEFHFSHDPNYPEAGSFFEDEVNYLKELGFTKFVKDGKHWKIVIDG